MSSEYDAVVAENRHAGKLVPEASRGALACPGMTQEEISVAFGIADACSVNLDAADILEAEAMHDEEFVQGIVERAAGHGIRKIFPIEQETCAAEFPVDVQALVGLGADDIRG